MNIFSISSASQIRIMKTDAASFTSVIACPYKFYLETIGARGENQAIENELRQEYLAYRTAAVGYYSQQHPPSVSASSPRTKSDPTVCVPLSRLSALGYDLYMLLVAFEDVKKPSGTKKQYAYIPLCFSPEPKVLREEKMSLAFTALVLSEAGYKTASYGRIIAGMSFSTKKIALAKLKRKARTEIKLITTIQETGEKSPLRLNRYCSLCCFSSKCRKKATEKDDLSLLSTLSSSEIRSLNNRGIFSVTQLSYTFRNSRSHRNKPRRKEKHKSALKALAIRDQQVYVRDPPALPDKRIQIFLDVESVPNRSFYYLIGAVVCDGAATQEKHFWADKTSDEKRIWSEFLSTLSGFGEFTMFHYGAFEAQFLRAMVRRYGLSGPLTLESLNESCVNVLTYYYLYIYCPTYSNSLKYIAPYFGYNWSGPIDTGLKSLQWRKRWEATGNARYRDDLINYNRQDCCALKHVADVAREIIDYGIAGKHTVSLAKDVKASYPYRLGPSPFSISEFKHITKCAYFDYQRTKIYWRTDDRLRKSAQRRKKALCRRQRVNKTVQYSRRLRCPYCRSRRIKKNRLVSKVTYDLLFMSSGVKKWVVKHIGESAVCRDCDKYFRPRNWPEERYKYRHGIMAWVIYQNIELGITHQGIMDGLNDLFGFSFNYKFVDKMKKRATIFYEDVYEEIKKRIRTGYVVHVDETKANVKGTSGFVWVFTNMEEVLYIFSESREGNLVKETLKGFKGILVSDYYSAYDSFPCLQQRCLIHLVRDLNDDLLMNPFDAEFKTMVVEFGCVLKQIVETIDRFGLKSRFLRKHRKEVTKYFRKFVECACQSDLAKKYQDRLLKNKNRLFTFLEYDGIPWNNNNAENAIKAFAKMRRTSDTGVTVEGLNRTLLLLSIAQTLKYKNMSFLDFLKSGERSLETYLKRLT